MTNISKKYSKISDGFNLYIDIATACNASCPFCIAPTVGRKNGPGYFSGLQYALDMTKEISGTVQIVGGEPMISKRLLPTLEAVRNRNFRRSVINTNGTFINLEVAQQLRDNLTHINISRHHYDEQNNQTIMNLRPELSNQQLSNVLKLLKGSQIRLQCNLIKGEIDNAEKMMHYMRWACELGVNEISFSQLFPLGLFSYQEPLELGYTEQRQVDLRRIVSDLDNMEKVQPDYSRNGAGLSDWGRPSTWNSRAKRRFWYGPNNIYFSLKTLNGYDETGLPHNTTYNKAEDPELQDELCFAVLHPDGRVTASWDRRERLLYNPHKQTKSAMSTYQFDYAYAQETGNR